MMILLLPSYNIEDFSVDRIDSEANQILSVWTALYHPALIEKANRLPGWESASHPTENECELTVVPPCCEHLPPAGWLDEREKKCLVIRHESEREVVVKRVLKELQLEDHGFEDWFVDAFLAMGTHYILSELLTRQLRYMSMLDEYQLKEKAIKAIKAYRNGEMDEARSMLQQVFEQLQQSREYFYPMTAYLIDLVLTAPTTLGDKLHGMLGENRQINLVLPLSSLKRVMRENGELLARMREETVASRLELVGDPLEGVPLTHLAMTDLVEQLMRGTEFYCDALGARPVAYMRKQADFISALPSLLLRAGYKGVLLYTTDGWQTPEKRHSLLRWGSSDGRKIGAISRYPIDGNSSEAVLQLPKKLGRMLESDYAPTITLAHYPKHARRWLNDLIVAAHYAPVFGRFHSLSGFFKATKYTGETKPLDESIYVKSRHLVEAVEKKRPNPVSAWGDYHQWLQRCQHIATLATLATTVAGKKSEAFAEARSFLETFDAAKQQHDRQLYGDLNDNADANDATIDLSTFAAEADRATKRLSCHLGAAITAAPLDTILEHNDIVPTQTMPGDWGYLLLNPSPHSRNMLIDISDLPALPAVRKETESQQSSPILLARDGGSRKEALVEVPPFGYAWVGCEPVVATSQSDQVGQSPEPSRPAVAKKLLGLFAGKKETVPPPLVERIEGEGYYLRNEFFELRLDETTGAVVSLFYHNRRGNRLAQQLAFRFPDEVRKQDARPAKDGNAGYSIMAADSIEMVTDSPLRASLKTSGRLMHFDGSIVATFEQTITVTRGSKIVRFDITITSATPPGDSPWDSYYAARFAWGNTGFEPYIGITSGRHACRTKYVEAPYFVDLCCCVSGIRDETQSLTVFTHGLPYHRRTNDTRLDTILIATGEQRSSFRVDVGVDVNHPMAVAQELMTPHEPLVIRSPKPKIPTAWLFSYDAKNIVLLKCEPLFDEIWQPPALQVNDPSTGDELQVALLPSASSVSGRICLDSANDTTSTANTSTANTSTGDASTTDASTTDASTYNAMSEPGYGYDGVYSPDYKPQEQEKEPRNNLDEGWRFPSLADSLQDDGRPMVQIGQQCRPDDFARIPPLTGMRLWLLETEGQRTELSFRSFRTIRAARVVDFELNEEKTLSIPGDRVLIPFAPHEFLPVEIRF